MTIKELLAKQEREFEEKFGYMNGGFIDLSKQFGDFKSLLLSQKLELLKAVEENLPKVIMPTVEPSPNKLSQNQIFAGGQMNMLIRVGELLASVRETIKELEK
jgi:hypothetical protein